MGALRVHPLSHAASMALVPLIARNVEDHLPMTRYKSYPHIPTIPRHLMAPST